MEPRGDGARGCGPGGVRLQRPGPEPPLLEDCRCLAGTVVPSVGEGRGSEVTGAHTPPAPHPPPRRPCSCVVKDKAGRREPVKSGLGLLLQPTLLLQGQTACPSEAPLSTPTSPQPTPDSLGTWTSCRKGSLCLPVCPGTPSTMDGGVAGGR